MRPALPRCTRRWRSLPELELDNEDAVKAFIVANTTADTTTYAQGTIGQVSFDITSAYGDLTNASVTTDLTQDSVVMFVAEDSNGVSVLGKMKAIYTISDTIQEYPPWNVNWTSDSTYSTIDSYKGTYLDSEYYIWTDIDPLTADYSLMEAFNGIDGKGWVTTAVSGVNYINVYIKLNKTIRVTQLKFVARDKNINTIRVFGSTNEPMSAQWSIVYEYTDTQTKFLEFSTTPVTKLVDITSNNNYNLFKIEIPYVDYFGIYGIQMLGKNIILPLSTIPASVSTSITSAEFTSEGISLSAEVAKPEGAEGDVSYSVLATTKTDLSSEDVRQLILGGTVSEAVVDLADNAYPWMKEGLEISSVDPWIPGIEIDISSTGIGAVYECEVVPLTENTNIYFEFRNPSDMNQVVLVSTFYGYYNVANHGTILQSMNDAGAKGVAVGPGYQYHDNASLRTVPDGDITLENFPKYFSD